MPLAAADLSFKSTGESSIAGGLNLADALLIDSKEASFSTNWRHRLGRLEFRDQLRSLLTFPSISLPTGPITHLSLAKFRSGSSYLMAIDKAHIWSWDGATTNVFTDITGSSITSGANTSPWSGDTGGAGSGLADVGFFACNGSNELIYWPGSSNAVKLNGHATYTANTGNPANLVGRYVVIFAGRVFLAYTTESGQAQPQRLRWCSDSDFFDWRTSARKGAGAVDLTDSPGEIVGLWKLAQQLYIAKTDSIVIGRETGQIDAPFAFPVALGVGVLSGQSFQAINPQTGIFLGNDNFYQISGAETQPIGDKIKGRKGFSGLFNDIDQSAARQVVSGIRPELNLYYCIIPLAGQIQAFRAYVYNYAEQTWWIEDYPTKIHAWATVLLGTGAETWATITGTWAQQTKAWDQFQPGASAPRTVVATEYSTTGSDRWRVHQFVQDGDYTDSAAVPQLVGAAWSSKLFKLFPSGSSYGAATIEGVWLYFDDFVGGTIVARITTDHDFVETKFKTFGSSRQVYLGGFKSTGKIHKLTITSTDRISIRSADIVYTLKRA